MTMNSGTASRIRKEITMLSEDPPPGVVFFPVDSEGAEVLDKFEAQITGPNETPYSEGIFRLEVSIPPRYPFEPPKVRFITPIYHPNIDDGGRICLDTLKMQPQGSWSPSVNMSTLLTSIRLLMAHPNPDDGLMPDITELYRKDLAQFEMNARASTKLNASTTLNDAQAVSSKSDDSKGVVSSQLLNTSTLSSSSGTGIIHTEKVGSMPSLEEVDSKSKVDNESTKVESKEEVVEEYEDEYADEYADEYEEDEDDEEEDEEDEKNYEQNGANPKRHKP